MSEKNQDKIITAFLQLAKDKAVHHLTVSELHEEKQAPAGLNTIFDVVDRYLNQINTKVVTGYVFDPEDSVRERLFDLLMQYFDELNAHKEVALNIERGFYARPLALIKRKSEIHALFQEMLDVTKAGSDPIRDQFRLRSLEGIFLMTYRVWKKDDTTDMAKTMATLDQHLAKAEKWEEKLSCSAWRRRSA